MDVPYTLGTVSGLALATGINTYFPLLVVAVVARFHLYPFQINPAFAYMTSDWFIALCALLVVLDFVADKIPGVSGVWNSIHLVLRPLAGALIAGAVGSPHAALVPLQVILGVGVTSVTTATQHATRTTASLATGGFATPFLSLAEDVSVVVMSVVSILMPIVMLVVAAICIALFIYFAPRVWRALQAQWRNFSSFLAWITGKRSNAGGERT